ncbi:MAG: ABC transporter substrate-binding protein [Candidatus Ornithospirochaeta sp.]
MKKTLLFLLVTLVSVSLFALGGKENSSLPEEKNPVITMAIPVDPDGLDPMLTAAASTFQITSNIYETLVTVDEKGNLQPCLADSWEEGVDGLSITFHLRKSAAFSNGKKCRSEEVKASFLRLMSPESLRNKDYSFISSIETPDEYTIVFRMDDINVAALSSFAYPWAAVVDTESENLKSSPMGTGPYYLSSWIPQERLVLERNPHYQGEVRNEGFNLVVMPDLTAEITALDAGEVDIILITGDLASAVENKGYNILAAAGNGLQLMAMNNKNEALSDIRVRQAINYAVDKDELIEAVWWGYGEKIGSHFPVVLKEYVDLSSTYECDKEKARELLKEAGYESGLKLRMDLPKNYQEYVNAGLVIASSLKDVGIEVDVNIVEWAYWLSEVYVGRNYDLTVVGHTGRLDPYALLVKYISTGSENYFNYSSSRVDELLSLYRTELDEEKRTQYIQEIQKILAVEVPALYIQDPIQIFVSAPDVFGFASFPINIYKFKDVYRE